MEAGERALMRQISFARLFEAADRRHEDESRQRAEPLAMQSAPRAIDRHMHSYTVTENMNGFKRMQICRQSLEALDRSRRRAWRVAAADSARRRGWNRSFHQRLFHEEYLKSVTRVFFKRDGPGSFARSGSDSLRPTLFRPRSDSLLCRAHSRILEINSWDSMPQEILVPFSFVLKSKSGADRRPQVSTPRRFGKTISVSMFAAAMMVACPNMELSIYSTCKRISQKLLRNIVKFMELIFQARPTPLRLGARAHSARRSSTSSPTSS